MGDTGHVTFDQEMDKVLMDFGHLFDTTAYELSGIPKELMVHQLNVDPTRKSE